ncbi:MAG: hypothetical protein QF666_01350 [Alphaproteobacteria bacterium]|jgi:hypothetical protein|nr:hypothetical protein [Alphaproteobacteria bacterium]MDP6588073.1 hypothetical protein [Alphaproteobacteria bacterium]
MAVLRVLKFLPILAAAALWLPALAVAAAAEIDAGPESPAASARDVLSDSAYQSDLPNRPAPEAKREISSSTADSSSRRIELPPIETRRDSSGPRDFNQRRLWAAAALAGALLIAYLLLIWYRARRRSEGGAIAKPRRRHKAPGSAPAPAAAQIDEPTILEQADRLAGAGHYGEAIHFLLLNGLDHVGRQTRQRIPPELTNRELLRALRLAENMAGALSVLVRLSERSHFGGAAPSAEDYRLSREKFQTFAQASAGAAS